MVTKNPNLFPPRAYHSAVYIEKHDVMVVCGGKLTPGKPAKLSSQCFMFHFATSTWQEIDPIKFRMPCLSGHSLVQISDSSITVIGGTFVAYGEDEDMNANIYFYDLDSEEFNSFNLAAFGFKGRYSMATSYSKECSLIALGGGFNNNSEESLTIIYIENNKSATIHFCNKLLQNKSTDISISTLC